MHFRRRQILLTIRRSHAKVMLLGGMTGLRVVDTALPILQTRRWLVGVGAAVRLGGCLSSVAS